MDFTLTDEQELIRSTARALIAKECPPALPRSHIDERAAHAPLWQHLRDFAALGTGDCTDLCLFVAELGYAIAPGPFFASAVMAAPILDSMVADALDAVVTGARIATVAVCGNEGLLLPNDESAKAFVFDADLADMIVVLGSSGACVIDRPDDLESIATVDFSRRLFSLAVPPTASFAPIAPELVAAWIDRVTTAYAAETVGVARRCFDMALSYAKERIQFDVPIGSFQAIQHKLAEMSLLVERATAATHYAAMTVDAADPQRTCAAHVAKAAAGEAARRCLKDSMQIHGGIGYTWEHDLQMFLRRATASEYLFGTTGYHHDRVADLLFA